MGLARRATVDRSKFNETLALPYNLRVEDFEMAIRDVYDFFGDSNDLMLSKGLPRLDDMLRPANLSGMLSDMVTDSLGKHSRSLTPNLQHNGHPDLLVRGVYPGDSVKSGEKGVEVKTTRKAGGAVDTHGAREQTLCVFVYTVDNDRNKAASDRDPLTFTEIYIGDVTIADFRRNERGELGTRTATLDKDGIARFRTGWVYMNTPVAVSRRGGVSTWRS